MALKALRLDTEREYISRFDPAKGTEAEATEATVFTLGALDARVYGRIKDKAATMIVNPDRPDDEVETTLRQNEVNFDTVMYGLKGWRNFRDEHGNDVPFRTVKRNHAGKSYTVVDPEVLKLVPQAVIAELAAEIIKDNEITEAQGKN